jgi:hypothetical protein
MPAKDSVSLSLQVPLLWWRRLQRAAERCHTSPGDFVRETLEAEVVRRELQHEVEEPMAPDWLKMAIDSLPPVRLHESTSSLWWRGGSR